MDYEKMSVMMKAMADPNRMKIIDILSCGRQCACEVLEHFDFTQPTLSHHMKMLEKAGIVTVSKEGQWHFYTLRDAFVNQFMSSIIKLFSNEDHCICQPNQTVCENVAEEKVTTV